MSARRSLRQHCFYDSFCFFYRSYQVQSFSNQGLVSCWHSYSNCCRVSLRIWLLLCMGSKGSIQLLIIYWTQKQSRISSTQCILIDEHKEIKARIYILLFGNSIVRLNKMEENIPYRRLKHLKSQCIKQTSEKLLKPIFRKRNPSNEPKDIMSQNVTDYQFMLNHSHLKQNYINWATSLRKHPGKPKPPPADDEEERPEPTAPSVFYKSTQLQELRNSSKGKHASGHLNTAQYSQFFGKDSQSQPQSAVEYVSQLRRNSKFQEASKSMHQSSFVNFGARDTSILPKLLKKTANKKLRDYKPQDFENANDGTHQYPHYSYGILRQKNAVLLECLSPKHSEKSVPNLAWTVGLRSY